MISLLVSPTNPMNIFVFLLLLLQFTTVRSKYGGNSPETIIDYPKYLYDPGQEDPENHNFMNGNQPSALRNTIEIIPPVSAINYEDYLYQPGAMKNNENKEGVPKLSGPAQDPYQKKSSFSKPNNVPECTEHEYGQKKVLGQGVDGIVYKVVHLATGVAYALKESVLDPIKIASLQEEIRILSRLKGTGITANIHCTEKQGKYFIMEFLEGVILETELINPTLKISNHNERFLYFTRKMATVYSHLQELGIVHLDGHPKNWVFHPSTQQLHLIDFGRAKDLKYHIPETTTSTRGIQQAPNLVHEIQVAGIMWECMNVMMLEKYNFAYVFQNFNSLSDYIHVLPPNVQVILKKMVNVSPSSPLSFKDVTSYLH